MTKNLKHTVASQSPSHPASGEAKRQQQAILKQVNYLAWLLDNSIYLPIVNYRIGLDAIVGLVPGLGDMAGAFVSSYIVLQAMRLGAPTNVLLRMTGNVAIEAVIGLIPLLGDFFDATFKANVRNVQLLNDLFAESISNSPGQAPAGRGVMAAVSSALLGLLTLTSGAAFAIFRRFMRRFV